MALQDLKKYCIESKSKRVVKEERKSIIRCRKEEVHFRQKRFLKEELKEFKKKSILLQEENIEELARRLILEHETSYHLIDNEYLPLLKDREIIHILPVVYTFL